MPELWNRWGGYNLKNCLNQCLLYLQLNVTTCFEYYRASFVSGEGRLARFVKYSAVGFLPVPRGRWVIGQSGSPARVATTTTTVAQHTSSPAQQQCVGMVEFLHTLYSPRTPIHSASPARNCLKIYGLSLSLQSSYVE